MILPIKEIEIIAKSLEEAIEQAAQQLDVDPSKIQIDLIEENKKLFGRGHVKIKARLIDDFEDEELNKKTTKSKKKTKLEDSKEIDKITEEKTAKKEAQPVQKNESQQKAKSQPKKEKVKIEINLEKEKNFIEKDSIADEEDAAEYLLVLREVLKLANLRVKAELKRINGRYVYVSLEGEDIGLLLTRRAETLNSLQYLLNIIIVRKTGKSIRISLDAGEYRQKREDSLCRLAQQIAKEVISRGEEAVLDPLPAFERRIIHNYLQEIEGIRTYSEGDEPNRYIVIAPKE